MSWRLTLAKRPPVPLDASALTPAAVAGLSERAVADLFISVGTQPSRVGDWFRLAPTEGDVLELDGETGALDRVGAGLRGGVILVAGPCGREAGLAMRGGGLVIRGAAGDGLGMGLRGGMIEVRGDAGDGIGSAALGERQGMRGGRILVHGKVGTRCGERMRRGEILIAGDAGALCGARMIAGTLVVLGDMGEDLLVGMRRGTLICARSPRALPKGFAATGTWTPSWLTLLARSWRDLPAPWAHTAQADVPVERAVGDWRAGGRGELLIWPGLPAG